MEDDEVRRVNKEKITSCMKCPLCDELYTQATTISECLHTFCKKCIYEKLEDEEEEYCPVCNTYLGVSPLEKLRPDHTMDDIKAKIFPSEGSHAEPSSVEPSVVEPPNVELAEAEPPKAEPKEAEPSALEPPVVQPPKAEPSGVKPPVVQPPKAEPSAVESPVVQPPKAEPTEAEPSVVEPTVVQQPKAEMAESEPSAVEPPIVQPPKAEPTEGVIAEAEPADAEMAEAEPPQAQMAEAEPATSEQAEAEMAEAEKPEDEQPEDEMAEAKTSEDEKRDAELAVSVPARTKERSISSLVVSIPIVSPKSSSTVWRSRIITRNVARILNLPVENTTKNEEQDSSENRSESSSSLTSSIQNSSSPVEPTGDPYPNQETEEGVEKCDGNSDLYEPLSCLVEAANRNKNTKVSSKGSAEKGAPKSKGHALKTKGKEPPIDVNEAGQAATSNPKKSKRNKKKKSTASGESVVSPQNVLDVDNVRWLKDIEIWLSLVAAEDQEGDDPLPQISSAYLRIKDGDMPVSSLQKYLMKKLDLESEEEVEIKCLGEPLFPELELNSLLKMWLKAGDPDKRAEVTVGSSGEDFVMELTYGRKVSSSESESDE